MNSAAAAPAWATTYTQLALAELPADLTTATPAQVDEAIRTLSLDLARLDDQFGRAKVALRLAVGQTRHEERIGTGRNRETVTRWEGGSYADALLAARANPAAENADWQSRAYRDLATVGDALAALDAVLRDMSAINYRLDDLRGEFDRRGGWARYYRVNNSNGHVHTDTACRTTYLTTQWQWPTQLSDADHAAVVDAAGALTCLVCFPDVREEIVANRPIDAARFETREQTAEREAREAEAKAKRDAKIAKAATADGSVLVVFEPSWRDGEKRRVELKTARAAELRYVDFMFEARPRAYVSDFARGVYTESALAIADALAAKEGVSRVVIESRLKSKVEKRIKRGY